MFGQPSCRRSSIYPRSGEADGKRPRANAEHEPHVSSAPPVQVLVARASDRRLAHLAQTSDRNRKT